MLKAKGPGDKPGPFFCLPSVAGKPGLLKEAGVTPTKGVAAMSGSEGGDRNLHTAQVNLIRLRGRVSVQNIAKPGTWSDPWSD